VQITLKIIGNQLFQDLLTQTKGNSNALPRSFRDDPIDWHLTYVPDNFAPEDLLCFPDYPCVLVVQAKDSTVEKIQSMEKHMFGFIRGNPDIPVVQCPVIMAFQSPAPMHHSDDFPDFVSDWIFAPIVAEELARRVFLALKRKNVLKKQHRYGLLTLIPDSRSVAFDERLSRLTPSEYTLAELFVSRLGKVITFNELVQFFNASGKSSASNNIRVAIYQLRLKLDTLTKSQFLLTNIYRQGYCLRQRSNAQPPRNNMSGSDVKEHIRYSSTEIK